MHKMELGQEFRLFLAYVNQNHNSYPLRFQLHPCGSVRAQERAAVRPADPAAGQLDRARPRGLRQLRQVLRLAHIRHVLGRLHSRTLGLEVWKERERMSLGVTSPVLPDGKV